MLGSKREVDKHVQEILRNINNEKERNLRCYNVAKLYHKVGDYQSTKNYVELYLTERPNVAGAHKLLGQAFEGLKDFAKALEEYKCSLVLENRQPDLVLKVCELIVETKTRLKTGEAKYWLERAKEISDSHQAVFRLEEYIIRMEDGSGDQAQLAQLVEKEIEARPEDVAPRIRLLKTYLDSNKVLDAYKYAIDLESRCIFRNCYQWYSCVSEVLQAYHQEVRSVDAEFILYHLHILDRFAAICSQEHLGGSSFTNALFALDQACFEASKVLPECVKHVGAQLCFYLATALLRNSKQSRPEWNDWTPYAWALLSLAYIPPETEEFFSNSSFPGGKEKYVKLLKLWKEDCAFRCSQAGHILLNMPKERERFIQLSGGNWREKIFKILFTVRINGNPNAAKSSYFMSHDKLADVQDIFPSIRDLTLHDELAQHQRPDSLHSLVWLGLRYLENAAKHLSLIGTPNILPYRLSQNFACHLFEELKFSSSVLDNCGVETLSRLDVDTFLYASIFCAAAAHDELQRTSSLAQGRPLILPVDLTDPLCSDAQSDWWSSAYRLHTNKSRNAIGEVRMKVSRGLEVVRLLGSHGMDVRLIVLLAKLFAEKASAPSISKDKSSEISKRAHLFWQCAITLLERMDNNQPLRIQGHPMFLYKGRDLTSSEIKTLLEEGRFFVACRLMKEEKHEKALEILQDLKNPYAAFYVALIYKKLADYELEAFNDAKPTSETKTNYVILLQKSRSALHLTLDRLRSPQNVGNHPLNVPLEQLLEDVESCLAKEETSVNSTLSRHPCEGLLDESFGPNRFEDSLQNASRFVNTSLHQTLLSNLSYANQHSVSQGLTSTPRKSAGSRVWCPPSVEVPVDLDASSARILEARPSPERLDLQLRRMVVNTDAVMQVVVDQNKKMLDSNKTMMDALEKTRSTMEELQKQMTDLQIEVKRLKQNESRSQGGKNPDYGNMLHPEEEYGFDVSSLRSFQGFPSASPYAPFAGHVYPAPASTVPVQPILPQSLYPQPQVPLGRNVDPNVLLASYYPGALGMHSVLPGTSSTSNVSGSISANMAVQVPPDSLSASDSSQKLLSLMGSPLVCNPSVANPGFDLSAATSASQSQDPVVSRFTATPQQGSLAGKTNVSWSGGVDNLPHNFQISMPPQATIPTTESLEKSLSPLKPITTESILPNVPKPAYSAVTSRQTDSKSSRQSVGSTSENDSYAEDADYNPCADFKPIIPLPEEVTVTTGEEDETPLFVRRAKLYRHVDGEWKERGIGEMKILKNNTSGKPRILMRRDHVFKICANHFILPEMELVAQKGSNCAWSWGAKDFADGIEGSYEKLCVRFKTVEDASQFKEVFDDARKMAKDSITPVKSSSNLVSGEKIESKVLTTQASPSSISKVEVGGFSFISAPVLKPIEHQTEATPKKNKENTTSASKPSPFASFSFFPPARSSSVTVTTASSSGEVSCSQAVTPTTSGSSLFGSKMPSTSLVSSVTSSSNTLLSAVSGMPDFAAIAAQAVEGAKKSTNFKGFEGAGSKVFGGSAVVESVDQESGDADDFVPTAVFNPVIPLPSLVEVHTGEEDEDVLFEERAKLMRFDSEQWKERGVGKMKVLKNRTTGKVRLLMRREQVLKVCCNHIISPEIQFRLLSSSDKAIMWSAQDFAEGEMRSEVFALKFRTPELMHSFKNVVEKVQQDIAISAKDNAVTAPITSSVEDKRKDNRPLSELFKPKPGSWECPGCFTRNNEDVTCCPCCSQPKPGCDIKASESKPSQVSPFSFGIKSSLAPATQPSTGFTFGASTTSDAKQPSLAELFKPKEGSWECKGCYMRCDSDKLSCPACETPKPGHEDDQKPAANSNFNFGVNPASSASFSFGIKSTSSTSQTTDSKAFSFATVASQGESKATFSFGAPPAAADSGKGFNFGSSVAPAASPGFLFGVPTSTTQPSSDSNAQLSFGSPHKFEFQIQKKSPGKSSGKSPGVTSGGEESEVEEEDENADVGDFKPVVPLPDKVPVMTGEEDENVLYCHKAKLYRHANGEWKERGLGDIKVLCHKVTNKPRLVMRRLQVLKICLNHYITPDLEMRKKDDKTWIWAAHDFSEGEASTETFACRFKTEEIADSFKAAVDKAKTMPVLASPERTDSVTPTEGDKDDPLDKEVESAEKDVRFNLPGSDKSSVRKSLFGSNDEVEVIYEAKVTPEEKSAALRLKLPENFYLYKQAPPCSGCPGCEEDSDSEHSDKKHSAKPTEAITSSSKSVAPATVFGGSGTSLFNFAQVSSPSQSSSLFGGLSSFTQPSTFSFSGGSIFGGTANSALGSTAVDSPSTAFSMLGSKISTSEAKDDKNNIPFLPVNNSLSFASLASSSNSSLFKAEDTSKPFAFEGSGAKVFGSLTVASKAKADEEEGDSGGENDQHETGGEVETHDPHFEPIIAMPDMIEVRTGEEDEEKLFCERAKLFRYDVKEKTWKERGVGEMKILKHRENGTIRLLLRRDQVHKTVLNQRLVPSLQLKPLLSSDKAWCWAGLNYAEDSNGVLEELAIRFKNPEQAQEFYSKLAVCQKSLEEASAVQIKDGEDEEDENEETDDEDLILLEKPVAQHVESDFPQKCIVEGTGTIRIISSSNGYMVVMTDDDNRLLFKTPIEGDAEVEQAGKVCSWKSFDFADNEEGVEKLFVSTFESEDDATEFADFYNQLTVEIVEQTYDYVDKQEE